MWVVWDTQLHLIARFTLWTRIICGARYLHLSQPTKNNPDHNSHGWVKADDETYNALDLFRHKKLKRERKPFVLKWYTYDQSSWNKSWQPVLPLNLHLWPIGPRVVFSYPSNQPALLYMIHRTSYNDAGDNLLSFLPFALPKGIELWRANSIWVTKSASMFCKNFLWLHALLVRCSIKFSGTLKIRNLNILQKFLVWKFFFLLLFCFIMESCRAWTKRYLWRRDEGCERYHFTVFSSSVM